MVNSNWQLVSRSIGFSSFRLASCGFCFDDLATHETKRTGHNYNSSNTSYSSATSCSSVTDFAPAHHSSYEAGHTDKSGSSIVSRNHSQTPWVVIEYFAYAVAVPISELFWRSQSWAGQSYLADSKPNYGFDLASDWSEFGGGALSRITRCALSAIGWVANWFKKLTIKGYKPLFAWGLTSPLAFEQKYVTISASLETAFKNNF